jgi:hypothetical protein
MSADSAATPAGVSGPSPEAVAWICRLRETIDSLLRLINGASDLSNPGIYILRLGHARRTLKRLWDLTRVDQLPPKLSVPSQVNVGLLKCKVLADGVPWPDSSEPPIELVPAQDGEPPFCIHMTTALSEYIRSIAPKDLEDTLALLSVLQSPSHASTPQAVPPAIDPVGQFFYEEFSRPGRLPDKAIRAKARREHPEWEINFSVQAMRQKAEKYRRDHALAPIPKRPYRRS